MIKIGIIKEYKIPNDFRTPFTPSQADEINKFKPKNISKVTVDDVISKIKKQNLI